MKISFLNFPYNQNKYSVRKGNYAVQTMPIFTQPLLKDTVSFQGKPKKNIYITDLRNIENLPCGCCGRIMIPNKKLNDFLEKEIYFPAHVSLQKIKEQNLFDEQTTTEEQKKAYNILTDLAKDHKSRNVSELLQRKEIRALREEHLNEKENPAFDEINELSQKVSHSSSEIIKSIEDFNPSLHTNEQKIFQELKKLSEIYPDKNFNEILNIPEVYNHYLKILLIKEKEVLNKVEKISEKLPENEKQIVKEKLINAENIFVEEAPEILKKRGRVIDSFTELESMITDKTIYKEIYNEIKKLPKSDCCVEAFMIQGAKKTSNRIAELILIRTRNTFEHVKPHKRENDPGENSIYNYIGLCGRCNYQRARTPYSEFVEDNPQMPQNEQRQIDKIISEINNGILYGYDDYPEKIKQALLTESDDKINIDISKLDKTLAENNRKIREKTGLQVK